MDEKRQVQKELFEEFIEPGKKRHAKFVFPLRPKRTVTLLFEHVIFIAIGLIIICMASYLLGVEKSKAIAVKVPRPPSSKAQEKAKAPAASFAYTIQIASCIQKEAAEKELQGLRKKGYKAFMCKSEKYYLVCTGEFKNKKDAESECKKMSRLYRGCMVKMIK